MTVCLAQSSLAVSPFTPQCQRKGSPRQPSSARTLINSSRRAVYVRSASGSQGLLALTPSQFSYARRHTHARCTHAHTHRHTCTHTCTHVYTHAHTHTHAHMCVHMYTHARTHVHRCTHTQCSHTRAHIHMHTTHMYTHTCTRQHLYFPATHFLINHPETFHLLLAKVKILVYVLFSDNRGADSNIPNKATVDVVLRTRICSPGCLGAPSLGTSCEEASALTLGRAGLVPV